MIGTITLDRQDAERPGRIRPDAGEAELGGVGSADSPRIVAARTLVFSSHWYERRAVGMSGR